MATQRQAEAAPAEGATPDPVGERVAREAHESVHGRLALLSCGIWTLGVFLLIWVAPNDGAIAAGAAVLLVPAGLVWLARGRLVAAETARRLRDAT